jgi:hypothetical protein
MWWKDKILNKKPRSLIFRVPELTLITDASPSGWGATLEFQTQEVLVSLGTWSKKQAKWTSNHMELGAIFLRDTVVRQYFRDLENKNNQSEIGQFYGSF